MFKTLTAFCGVLLLAGAPAFAAQVAGDYVEARTADVYTGPCFSNAEVFITGNQAVMAWRVTEGSWNGVDVSGLSVAAAVRGSSTFSEDQPELAKSVLIVDKTASPKQREALIDMAKTLGGERLSHVVAVKDAMISLTVESHGASAQDASDHSAHASPKAPRGSFWAPGLAEIYTRPIDEGDHFCGNETVAYAPLSQGVKALPAYTLGHYYKGDGLNNRWDSPNCRSSFVGHFSY